MLNSYVPFGVLILFVAAAVLRIYVPWWLWIFAIASDVYNINETREWRRAQQKDREEKEKIDRIVRDSLAAKK